MYLKIRSRLAAHTTVPRAPSEAEMLALAQGLARRNATWPHPLALSTCAEALNLSALGIASNACVDPALVSRLCPDDAEIQRFCGLDPTRASLLPASRPGKAAKDPSRRKHCQCLPAKDIGAYSTLRPRLRLLLCQSIPGCGPGPAVVAAARRGEPDLNPRAQCVTRPRAGAGPHASDGAYSRNKRCPRATRPPARPGDWPGKPR